jgi:hypothetical protein
MTFGANGTLGIAALAATLVCGCADGGIGLTTASTSPETSTAALRADPMCSSLANQIEALKSDGTIGRLEKAAVGKSDSVRIKRDALLKQTELNKANADFRARCGPKIPKQAAAASTTPTTAAASKTVAAAAANASENEKPSN